MNIHYEFNSHEIITILQLLLGDKYIAKYIYSLKNKSENNDALIYHKSLRRSYNMIESSLISQCSNYIPLSCDIPVSYETWILIRDLKVDILCFFENFICSYQRNSHDKILLSPKDLLKNLSIIITILIKIHFQITVIYLIPDVFILRIQKIILFLFNFSDF